MSFNLSCVLIVFQVDKASCLADYVEFVFQDQYLGRNEMWRLSQHLVGQCVYKNQEVSFIGSIGVKIQAIYVGGEKVRFFFLFTPTASFIQRCFRYHLLV